MNILRIVYLIYFLLLGVKWMNRVERENISHLLATMHIVLRQQDGQETGPGQYKHITNTSFEKFVERYYSLNVSFFFHLICDLIFLL